MKKIILFLVLIFLSISFFAQKIQYSVSAGSNYSFFSLSIPKNLNNENVYSNINVFYYPKDFYGSDYTKTYSQLIQIKQISSRGRLGFYLNNNFTFPINNYLSFKTGLGFRKKNINYNVRFLSINNYDETIKDSSKFINPFFVQERAYFIENVFSDTLHQTQNMKLQYSIYELNTPLLLQVKLFKENLLISSGVSFSIILTSNNKPEINSIKIEKYNSKADFEQLSINFYSNIEYRIYKNIFASLSFAKSLTNIKNKPDVIIPNSFYYNFKPTKINTYKSSINLGFTYKF